MEDGLVLKVNLRVQNVRTVLILVVVEDGLVPIRLGIKNSIQRVLILVVVEDGLVLTIRNINTTEMTSLNPCCSGRWSRTTLRLEMYWNCLWQVLILVVVEDGLVQIYSQTFKTQRLVLILVVVEDGLVRILIRLFIKTYKKS